MVVVAPPSLIRALTAHVRSFAAEWHALGIDSAGGWRGSGSGLRIAGRVAGGDNGWRMPTRGVLLRRSGGPTIGEDYALGIKTSRVDTFSYGATDAEAEAVWALLDAILVPVTGARSASFEINGVRVANIAPEADAASIVEPDTGWPRVFCPYLITWRAA